jgi:hypothetical protein
MHMGLNKFTLLDVAAHLSHVSVSSLVLATAQVHNSCCNGSPDRHTRTSLTHYRILDLANCSALAAASTWKEIDCLLVSGCKDQIFDKLAAS